MEYGLVLVWLATYLALAVVALPVAALLFPRFADRGAGVAFALSMAVLAVVGYWVGQVAFGWTAVLAALAVLSVASGLALRRGVETDWRGFVDAALVFALAFALLVGVRALDPAAWGGGGEKFLDFGLLSSLLRADTLPPEDVWYAGEPVRYYYLGHMVAAMLSKLTRTDAVYAYNLALAGSYATLVAAAFGLSGAIGAARGYSRRASGAFAAFFVGVASNLHTSAALAFWLLPGRAQSAVVGWVGIEPKGLAVGPGEFDYWLASRVIEGAINEFPFFAWLNGDLHGHMMVQPLVLLAAALSFAYWQTPAERVWRRRALVFVALPVLAGVVAGTSTWSFPIVAGLGAVTLALASASPVDLLPGPLGERLDGVDAGRLAGEAGRSALAAGFGGVIVGLGALVVLPFLLGLPGGQGVSLLPDRSALGPLLVVHGAFLAVTVAYLLARSRLDRSDLLDVLLASVVLLAVAWWLDVPAVGLFAPLLVGGWWLLRTGRRVGFETVLVVAISGLVLLVEFVYVQEQAGPGRFNTVFKTYAQVWALWGTAAGAMLAGLVDVGAAVAALRDFRAGVARRLGRDPSHAKTDGAGGRRPGTDGNRRAVAAALLASFLVVSLSLYAGFALAAEIEHSSGDPTLDARAYLHDYHPDEVAAVEWLADLEGQPNMASAPGTEIYRWVNGPASLSGVPTVAGWISEIGYRGEEAYFERLRDVEILFTGDATSRTTIVRKYDVEYVYVGPNEKERYDDPDFGDEPGFSVAFEGGNVTIYAVDHSELG